MKVHASEVLNIFCIKSKIKGYRIHLLVDNVALAQIVTHNWDNVDNALLIQVARIFFHLNLIPIDANNLKFLSKSTQLGNFLETMGLFWLSGLSIELSYNTELYQILDFLTAKKIYNFDLNIEKCSKNYINKSYNPLIKLGPALNLTGQPWWLIQISNLEFFHCLFLFFCKVKM